MMKFILDTKCLFYTIKSSNVFILKSFNVFIPFKTVFYLIFKFILKMNNQTYT